MTCQCRYILPFSLFFPIFGLLLSCVSKQDESPQPFAPVQRLIDGSTVAVDTLVFAAQQKRDGKKQQATHAHALIRSRHHSIVLLALFLVASLSVIVLLRKVSKQKNRMLSLQNAARTLDKTTKDLQRQQQSTLQSGRQLRETLLWKFNVQHKVALLKSELQPLERMDTGKALAKFGEIVYGKSNPSQWDALEQTIGEIYPGLPAFIRRTYPQFSDTELKVALLSYARLRPKEIALLLNQSLNTVNMARTKIRKKMEIPEKGGNFCSIIERAYREQG